MIEMKSKLTLFTSWTKYLEENFALPSNFDNSNNSDDSYNNKNNINNEKIYHLLRHSHEQQ